MTDASEPPTVGDGQATAPLPQLDRPGEVPPAASEAAVPTPESAPGEPAAAEPAASQPSGAQPAPEQQAAAEPSTPQPTVVQPAAAAPAPAVPAASAPPPDAAPPQRRPGFRERGRMRRRLRYLRKLRELQARDLGGLVFDLRRFERKRDDLVARKVDQIRACDDELRALERALDERRDLRDVREPGVGGTCPRCFAIHGSIDRFCASCGAALGGAVQGPAQVPPAAADPPPQ